VIGFVLAAVAANLFAATAIGMPLTQAVRPIDSPSVASTDVGTVWSWDRSDAQFHATQRITTDDNGLVEMVDYVVTGGSAPLVLATAPSADAPLTFGSDTAQQTDKQFGAPDFVGKGDFPDGGQADFRGYAMAEDRELVLLFGSDTHLLREVFFGRRATLASSGLIPGDTPSHVYRAPVMKRLGDADYQTSKEGIAYTRIVVNSDGSVADASIFISSGNSDIDALALQVARHSTFAPGTRDGVPVRSVFFRRENFVVAPH
jgi:TonB family protein